MFGVSGIASGLELSAFFTQGRWDWPQSSVSCGKAVTDARTGLHCYCNALQSPIHPIQGTGLSCCALPALGTLSVAGWLCGLSSALGGRDPAEMQILHPAAPGAWGAPLGVGCPRSQQRRDAAGRAQGWLLALAGLQDGSGCGMGTAQAGPMGTEDGWQPQSARLGEVLLWK